jgi:hypothetical protein
LELICLWVNHTTIEDLSQLISSVSEILTVSVWQSVRFLIDSRVMALMVDSGLPFSSIKELLIPIVHSSSQSFAILLRGSEIDNEMILSDADLAPNDCLILQRTPDRSTLQPLCDYACDINQFEFVKNIAKSARASVQLHRDVSSSDLYIVKYLP